MPQKKMVENDCLLDEVSACCKLRAEFDQDSGELYCKGCFKPCEVIRNPRLPHPVPNRPRKTKRITVRVR